MPRIFTKENKEELKTKLLDDGFIMLKKNGLSNVNIDKLTKDNYIAKGTFFNLFENKNEYIYHMMIHKREHAKNILISYLNSNNKLTSTNLKKYLHWLCKENPNVFSYLTEKEKKRLISSWNIKYIENEENDSITMHKIISLLEKPNVNPNWKLACNYMKLIALSLSTKKIFIEDNYDELIESLINNIISILCV